MTDQTTSTTWEFTVTREVYYQGMLAISQDLKKNRHIYFPQNPWHQWVNLAIIIAMACTLYIGGSYLDQNYPGEVKWILLGLLLIVMVCIFAVIKLSIIDYKLYPRDNGPCLGRFKLSVNKAHMKLEGKSQTSLTSLDAIFKIETNQSQILVFLDPHLAFPIPKRDIGDEAAFQRLIEALTPRK